MPLILAPDSPKTRLPRSGKVAVKILIGVAVLLVGAGAAWKFLSDMPTARMTAEEPVTADVYSYESPFDNSGRRTRAPYAMIASASRPWRIVALFPHMKDSFWVSVDYGLVEQARRLGVSLRILHAGGYENLAVQREQMQNCIRSGDTDAIVLGAISIDGLNDLVTEAKAKGIVVVDNVNGVSSHD